MSNVTFEYDTKPVLKNISFECTAGEKTVLLGKNGSGKSTIVKLLDGLLKAKTGQIVIDGNLLIDDNIKKIRDLISMVFQDPDDQFVGATVEDDIAFGMENRNIQADEMKTRINEVLEKLDLKDLKTRIPNTLSGGQKQRVALADALVLNPKILLLDEATSMLDPQASQNIYETVNSLNIEEHLTTFSVTHDVNEAAKADHLLVLNEEKIVFDGKPSDFFKEHEKLIEMDLDLPFSEGLKDEFESAGFKVPKNYMNEQEISKWVLKLF